MTANSPFPIVSVEGGAYDRGVQYGAQVKTLIEEAIALYRESFKNVAHLEWDRALDLGRKFVPYIEGYDPEVVEEMEGIASGSGRTFEEILTLNARSEVMYSARSGVKIEEEGCTVMAATPEVTASKHMLVGQNADWIPASQKLWLLTKKKKKGGLNCVTFAEAGIVGKMGLNEAGILSFGNALASNRARLGVPLQIISNYVLSAETVADAIFRILSARRGASNNRVIADSEGLCRDIEAETEDFNCLSPVDGILVHTNHFLGPTYHFKDCMAAASPSTLIRKDRAYDLLAKERGRITVDVMKRIFRDHLGKPSSICMHVDAKRPRGFQSNQTIASLIVDLNQKTLDIAKGPPCKEEYASINLSDIL
jgi:isopenicillin-N N-acyltransferase-like protein